MEISKTAVVLASSISIGCSSPQIVDKPVQPLEDPNEFFVGGEFKSHLTTTPVPGDVVDPELSEIARRVAKCVFEHDNTQPPFQREPLGSTPGESVAMEVWDGGDKHKVVAFNFIEGQEKHDPSNNGSSWCCPLPVDSLHLDITRAGEKTHAHFRDVGLDGMADEYESAPYTDHNQQAGDYRRLPKFEKPFLNEDLLRQAQVTYVGALRFIDGYCSGKQKQVPRNSKPR